MFSALRNRPSLKTLVPAIALSLGVMLTAALGHGSAAHAAAQYTFTPDVRVTFVSENMINFDDQIDYTFRISNFGSAPEYNVFLTDTVRVYHYGDSQDSFVAAPVDGSPTWMPWEFLGTFYPGQSRIVTVHCSYNSEMYACLGARLRASGSGGANPANMVAQSPFF